MTLFHSSAKFLALITLTLLVPRQAVYATTEVSTIDIGLIKTFLTGRIVQADAEHFERIEKAAKQITETTNEPIAVSIELDSSGGDVTSAMRIGRVLRRMKSLAIVKNNATCASACILVLAGAGYRAVEQKARLGIHRPYQIESEESSPEKERTKYHALQKGVESYLDEMNIAKSLYQDMLRISPQNIKFLSMSESEHYGLGQNDPFFDEADELKRAKSLGISRQELAKRRASVFSICGSWPDNNNKTAMDSRLICDERVIKSGK